MELVSYDRIGMQYYYLGDMERSAYYHDRMMRGKFESSQSDIRKIAMTTLKKRKDLGSVRSIQPKQPAATSMVDTKSLAYSQSATILRNRQVQPITIEDNMADVSDVSMNNLPSPRGGSGSEEALFVLANCPLDNNIDR
jgi:hypothetical protein